jgi:hypothetical protein
MSGSEDSRFTWALVRKAIDRGRTGEALRLLEQGLDMATLQQE